MSETMNYFGLLLLTVYYTLGGDFEKYVFVKNRTLNDFSSTLYTDSYIACIYRCKRSAECLSVSYNELNSTCYFHADHPVQTNAGLTVSAGFTLYYSHGKFGLYFLSCKESLGNKFRWKINGGSKM